MLLKIIKTILVAFLFIIAVLSSWLSFESACLRRSSRQKIFFEVEKGKGVKAIAQSLKAKGVIKKKWAFLVRYELSFYPRSLKAGEYLFTPPYSTQEILDYLTRGKIYLHPVTVAEGLTAKETIELFLSYGFSSEEEFWRAFQDIEIISSWDRKAQNLEGYLYPETYYFPRSLPAKEIVQKMAEQFKAVFNESWRRRAADLMMTTREIVILASLIEKEASLHEEKKLISSVFHNRLKLRMKLDCDPTIIYVLKQKGKFEGKLRSRDLRLDSPYNTYLYAGLPPGPICNPGKESLEAALWPDEDSYLYFVSKNDGSHHFSRSFKEHQLAVRKFQKSKKR